VYIGRVNLESKGLFAMLTRFKDCYLLCLEVNSNI